MDQLLIEAHYFPSIEYFVNILEHKSVSIEAWETYQKQSYRNRCRILTANKVDVLSVPITNPSGGVLIRDIKMDYSQKWANHHWRAIQSAYGKAPFYEYYGDFFHNVLFKKQGFLFDLNMELLTVCLKLLGLSREIVLTNEYKKEIKKEITDLRSQIHPKSADNTLIRKWEPYHQIFGSNFVNNLSILDLLFCEGTNALSVLQKSKKSSTEQI
jgi:hypothetical protein